jgi:lipopolysaccharide transport system ATP-binding protein
MSKIAIKAENLSKRYRIGLKEEMHDTLFGTMASWLRSPLASFRQLRRLSHFGDDRRDTDDIIWALKDVSFEVNQGEVVGVIGRNGAGKTTLLKILSRITEPTSGRAVINGRVSSLLEVGTGFHPELTGRENVYLNGTVLGMTKAEVDRKFDEIVDFSGVEKFIDTPVKRYSSGMQVRLAFSVAAHLEPEIMLVDEVLAVGDSRFQKKCLGKMDRVSKEGRTVLFVSHNMAAVDFLTGRTIYIRSGKVAAYADSRRVIEQYLTESQLHPDSEVREMDYYRRDHGEQSPVKTVSVWINDVSDPNPTIYMGEAFTINVKMKVTESIQDAHIDVTLKNANDDRVVFLFSRDQKYVLSLKPGEYVVSARVDELTLAPGSYSVDVGINQSVRTRAFDVIRNYPVFCVASHDGIKHWVNRPWGVVHCDSIRWQTSRIETTEHSEVLTRDASSIRNDCDVSARF